MIFFESAATNILHHIVINRGLLFFLLWLATYVSLSRAKNIEIWRIQSSANYLFFMQDCHSVRVGGCHDANLSNQLSIFNHSRGFRNSKFMGTGQILYGN